MSVHMIDWVQMRVDEKQTREQQRIAWMIWQLKSGTWSHSSGANSSCGSKMLKNYLFSTTFLDFAVLDLGLDSLRVETSFVKT